MKRSTVNQAIDRAIAFFQERNFILPEYAYFTFEDWRNKGKEYDEVRIARLGWDVTDFGSGTFDFTGRTIFTLRNGRYGSMKYTKTYAQKVMCLMEDQKSPIHYHVRKMEDILNQGGGEVLINFWKSEQNHALSQERITVSVNGKEIILDPGVPLTLTPGQSVCVTPGTYHQFWAREGLGMVLGGEVSSVCDDIHDNYFLNQSQRFPMIEEDEPKRYLLCSEYQQAVI